MSSFVRSLVAIFGMVVLGLVAGCSSSSDEESTSSEAYTPVTIDHVFGSTTLDKLPTKVVTLGAPNWTDTLAALDIPITAEIVQEGYSGPNNTFEWTPAHESQKEVVADPTTIDVATIAKFEPDLILSAYLPDQATYDKLSQLAPTIPTIQKGATVDTWETIANTAGEIFNKKDEATKLVDETNQKIADFKSANPQAEGKTFTFAQVQPTGGVGAVNSTEDSAAGLIAQLGFTLNPELAALHQDGGPTRSMISSENANLLNSDLLIIWPLGQKSDVEKVPGWNDLTAVKNDSVVYLSNDNAPAFGTPSAPSVGYVIDLVTPAAKNLQ